MARRATSVIDLGNRHLQTEEMLTKMGISFTYTTGLATNRIDLVKSQNNQARIKALDEDIVRQYEKALADGDTFPPVIVYMPGKGSRNVKYVLADGNHRAEAHHRAKKSLDAYVLDPGTRADLIVLLTYKCNTKHGLSMSVEERADHALYLVRNGVPIKKAAAEFNIALNTLTTAKRHADIDERAVNADIDPRTWGDLSLAVRGLLIGIDTDEILKSAANLAAQARLNSTQTKDMVNQLKGSKSTTKQQTVLRDLRASYKEQIADAKQGLVGARTLQTPKSRLQIAVGQVNALGGLDNIGDYFGTEDRVEFADRVRQAGERLLKVAEALSA
jgi:hypothetical protein